MADAVPGLAEAAAAPEKMEQADGGAPKECCRYAWLAALTLAENLLLDVVYDRVQTRSPHDAVRQCVFAIRGLKEMRRAAWACEDG